jgi:hypothetical protein
MRQDPARPWYNCQCIQRYLTEATSSSRNAADKAKEVPPGKRAQLTEEESKGLRKEILKTVTQLLKKRANGSDRWKQVKLIGIIGEC